MRSEVCPRNSKRQSSEGLRKEELYDRLLSFLGADSESIDKLDFEEWKENGPIWEKELISEYLLLNDRICEFMNPVSNDLVLEIRRRVLGEVEKLSAEEIEAIDRTMMNSLFQKAVLNSDDLSGETKDVFMKCLTKPLTHHENGFRRVVGLGPVKVYRRGS